MVTEGGAHVVINLESVRHVNVEAFFVELEGKGITGKRSHASSPKLWVVRCITGLHQGLGNPKAQGAQARCKERRKKVRKEGEPHRVQGSHGPPLPSDGPQTPAPWAQLTIVSRLLVAVPVQRPIILSMHFLWMAALHS